MAQSPERRKSASLLSLIASKAIVPGSFSEKSDAQLAVEEAHHTQTMMYAARMKYLDDTDQIKPDPLFMTRKQAQKVAQRHDTATMSLRKLDVGPQMRKPNAASPSSNAGLTAWKKANRTSTDERNQVWEAKFQAGCHFWQNRETAECRVTPPATANHIGGEVPSTERTSADDNDDVPFPDAFAFLNTGSN